MFPTTIIKNEPHFRQRPKELPGYHRFSKGSFDLFVSRKVLMEICRDALEDSPNEMIGKLVGRSFSDQKGFYTLITESIPCIYAEATPSFVQTTLKDELYVSKVMREEFPTEDLSGWYHSHTFGFEKYSGTDFDNQRAWGEEYHIGLLVVCSPASELVYVFAYRGPESERLGRSFLTLKCFLEPEVLVDSYLIGV